MKRNKLGVSFYLKLFVVTVYIGSVFYFHHQSIKQVLSNPDLSYKQRVMQLSRTIMGLSIDQETSIEPVPYQELTFPGNKTPITDTDVFLSHSQMQAGQVKADSFNQDLDLEKLNQAFTKRLQEIGTHDLQVGQHLRTGNLMRLNQLSRYAYLDGKTPEGQDFRTCFSQIEVPEYRLGENLYEVFIAADDIHLQTWAENEEVFADYLTKVFLSSDELSDQTHFSSLYVSAKAAVSDYQMASSTYIRLVVVLTLDTQMN